MIALDLDSSHQPLDRGKMIAIIRYKTPNFINSRDPLFISFVLINDVSLRCVLGLPTLLALGGLINLVQGEFIFLAINEHFRTRGYLRVSYLIIALIEAAGPNFISSQKIAFTYRPYA